jgi:hypothetical protein
MQLYAAIGAKTALHFWLTCPLGSLRVPHAFQHFRYLPPDSRFQYRNANQFPVSCGLASISWHLIFQRPSSPPGAYQKKGLPFAGADFLPVIAPHNQNGVLLICTFDFEGLGYSII